MEFPEELRYTKSHEWVQLVDGKATIGISAFAVEQLGDITLVEVPEVGTSVKAGESLGTIESVKSVSELYAPIDGKVDAVNDRLEDAPELVNDAPYGDGWLVKLVPTSAADVDRLLDHRAYGELVAQEQ